MRKQYIFGPVASRRLGVSLGLDLIRERRCTLDCIYCEAGKTVDLSCRRLKCADIEDVKNELTEILKDSPQLDYITFSGTGEPTLHKDFTEFAKWLRQTYPQYKICLLTNGTLLNDADVRSALQFIDIFMPNFDASNDEEYQIINRPAAGLDLAMLANGIRSAAAEYPGKGILELFVVPGVNDSDASIERFASYISSFKGLKSVQLNTLDRPGVVDWIKPAPPETLRRFIAALENILPVEAIGRYRHRSGGFDGKLNNDEEMQKIIELFRRRSGTAEDLALTLNMSPEKVRCRAEELVKAGILSAEKFERGVFYRTILSDTVA